MPRLNRPLLKYEIEDAQKNSISANAAARYLGVDIATYKKYAQFHGIYENLLNQRGMGVAKGYAKSCLLYTSPSPRDRTRSRMPSSA